MSPALHIEGVPVAEVATEELLDILLQMAPCPTETQTEHRLAHARRAVEMVLETRLAAADEEAMRLWQAVMAEAGALAAE